MRNFKIKQENAVPSWEAMDAAVFMAQIGDRVDSSGYYIPEAGEQNKIYADLLLSRRKSEIADYQETSNATSKTTSSSSILFSTVITNDEAPTWFSERDVAKSSNVIPVEGKETISVFADRQECVSQNLRSETVVNVGKKTSTTFKSSQVNKQTKHIATNQRTKTVMTKTAESQCGQCGKSFTTKTGLKQHMNVHAGLRPFVCDNCGRGFTQKTVLRIHMRVHTGEKPYKCQTCARNFRDLSTFIRHRRTHTGEKPYHCKMCRRAFSQSSNLQRHIKVCHSSILRNRY